MCLLSFISAKLCIYFLPHPSWAKITSCIADNRMQEKTTIAKEAALKTCVNKR
jgi:hypothetical protein